MPCLTVVKGAQIKDTLRQHAQPCSKIVHTLLFRSFLLRGSRVGSQVVQQAAARCLLPRGARTTQVSIRRKSAAKILACAAQVRNDKVAGLHAAESSSAPVGRASKFRWQFYSEYQAPEPASADTSTSDKQDVRQRKDPLFRFGVITGEPEVCLRAPRG
jgi:hypothetical protein